MQRRTALREMPGSKTSPTLYATETAERWRSEPMLGASEQPLPALQRRVAALTSALAAGPSDVCVVSTASGRYDSTSSSGKALLQNKLDFCKACGYRCLIDTSANHGTSRSAKWDKLLLLHDAQHVCNVTLYVDADVVFRKAFQLRPLTRSWLAATKDYVGINTGVLLVVRSRQAREFLPEAWRQSFFAHSFCAEQNAIRLVLRRPFVEKRERTDRVTIFENLATFQHYHSAFGEKVQEDTNFTAPLYHAAGCTNSVAMSKVADEAERTRICQRQLLAQLPPEGLHTCPSLEQRFRVASFAFNRHTQRGGATNLGRRWLIGRDLRIKPADQKGINASIRWWLPYPGCSEDGCGDAGAAKRKGAPQA